MVYVLYEGQDHGYNNTPTKLQRKVRFNCFATTGQIVNYFEESHMTTYLSGTEQVVNPFLVHKESEVFPGLLAVGGSMHNPCF